MGKYERRIFLDRLVELRDDYRATAHEGTRMTTEGAIDYAAALFNDTERLETILAESATDSTSTSQMSA